MMEQITMLDDNFNVYGDAIVSVPALTYSDGWTQHGTMLLSLNPSEFQNTINAFWFAIGDRIYENETPLSDSKDNTYKITGSAGSVLFDLIIIEETERLRGRIEERVRYIVNKYAMTGGQRIPKLTLEPDNGYKQAMDDTTEKGQTLSEFLYTALNQRGFSYTIRLDRATGNLVFKLLKATDRSYAHNGIVPVVMSSQDAIKDPSYKRSKMDYRNYFIVCDEAATNPKTVKVDLSRGGPVRAKYVKGSVKGATDGVSKFVLGGTGSTANSSYLATSVNGAAFTAKSLTLGVIRKVLYENGFFFAGGDGHAYSENADTWTEVDRTGVVFEDISYNDGLLTLSDTGFFKLYAGYDFANPTVVYTGTKPHMAPVKVGDLLIAPARRGSNHVALDYLESEDGFTYVEKSFNLPNVTRGSIAKYADGNGVSVFGGYTQNVGDARSVAVLVVSNDEGRTWKEVRFPASWNSPYAPSSVDALCFGNGVFVVVAGGRVAWSPDAENWTKVSTGLVTAYYAVNAVFDGTQFNIYSDHDDDTTIQRLVSPDGNAWTLSSVTLAVSTLWSAAFGKSNETGNLYQDGLNAAQNCRIVEIVDGDVDPDLAPVYETDYQLGDVLAVVDVERGIQVSKRATTVEFTHTDTEDIITPKLGANFLSIRQLFAPAR